MLALQRELSSEVLFHVCRNYQKLLFHAVIFLSSNNMKEEYICLAEKETPMKKKIVVITGSPRKNGNSFAMTDAFIKAAEKKGHSITRYDAADMEIKGCTACESCFKAKNACVFDADFNSMVPVIEEADVVVFATPLYWYTFPAQLKAVIDKLFALYNRPLAKLCTQFKVAYTCDETKAKSEPLSSISISFC